MAIEIGKFRRLNIREIPNGVLSAGFQKNFGGGVVLLHGESYLLC